MSALDLSEYFLSHRQELKSVTERFPRWDQPRLNTLFLLSVRSIGDWYHELDEELQETVLDPIIDQAETRQINDRSIDEDENEVPPLPNINFDPKMIPSQNEKSGVTEKQVITKPKPTLNIDPSAEDRPVIPRSKYNVTKKKSTALRTDAPDLSTQLRIGQLSRGPPNRLVREST